MSSCTPHEGPKPISAWNVQILRCSLCVAIYPATTLSEVFKLYPPKPSKPNSSPNCYKPTFTLYARVQPFISICTSAQSAVESKQLRRSALRNSDARQVQRMMVMTQMVYCRISWRGYPMVSLGFKPNLPTSCSLSHASRCIAARSSGGDGWLCYAQCPCELRGLSGLMQPKPGFRNVCRVMIAGIWTAVQGQDYVWTDAVQAWQWIERLLPTSSFATWARDWTGFIRGSGDRLYKIHTN